jgi:hypothetical protein
MKKILFVVLICLLCSTTILSQSKKTWESTQSLNSVSAYEDFLKKYPKGEYSEKAKLNLQELEFINAEKINTIQVYEAFISKYGQSQFVPDAKKKIEKLNLLDDWQKAKEANTIDAYRNFITKYPDSYYVSDAKSNMETIDWNSAKTLGTAEAMKSFLVTYPAGSHAKEAKTILNDKAVPPLVKSSDLNKAEKVKTAPSKGEKVAPQNIIDSTQLFIGATIKAIRTCSIKMIGKNAVGSIEISKEFPLIVSLLKSNDANSEKIENYLSLGFFDTCQVKIYSNSSMKLNNVQIGMQLPGSAQNTQWVTLGSVKGYIKSGECELTGNYFVNAKPISFENTKLLYEDNISAGKVNEGAVCYFNGKIYKYLNETWRESD